MLPHDPEFASRNYTAESLKFYILVKGKKIMHHDGLARNLPPDRPRKEAIKRNSLEESLPQNYPQRL